MSFHYRGLKCKSRKSRKIPEKQLNEVEIGNLLEKEFKLKIIKMIQGLWKTMEKMQKMFTKGLQNLLELTPKKDVLFIIGDYNAKVGSQEIPGVTGKFGLAVQNEAGQRLKSFAKRTHWS